MNQYYTDDAGNVSMFTDARENYHSQKAKKSDITVVEGDAIEAEIADDINFNRASAAGKAVGWRR